MKKIFTTMAAALAFGMMASSCGSGISTGNASMKTATDSAAYAHGVLNGEAMARYFDNQPGEKMDMGIMLNALQKALKGEKTQMTSEEAQNFLNEYYPRMMERVRQKNLEEQQQFLAENGGKEGVITTESGLQYQIETLGEGVQATSPMDTVVVHYKGTFINGDEFDSSYKRNEPATFPLNGVIAGWTEGLQLAPAGSKMKLWIPSDLGYPNGNYGIEANTLLIFDVEILEVKPYVPAAE